jgi:Transposase DDE domain
MFSVPRGCRLSYACIENAVDPRRSRKRERRGICSRRVRFWNEADDEYRCPQGHALLSDRRQFKTPRSRITKDNTVIYRSSPSDCSKCVLKNRCCPNTPTRRIKRSIYEDARNVARALAATWDYRRSRRERKKIEMLFAHLKRILKLDRLRLRGLSGAQDEFLLAATAQNLRRMAKWLTIRLPKSRDDGDLERFAKPESVESNRLRNGRAEKVSFAPSFSTESGR